MKSKNFSVFKKDPSVIRQKVPKLVRFNRQRMLRNHQGNLSKFNKNVINSIIYNEKEHIVAEFKDYLIFDDFSEFLKRFYRLNEAIQRLPKITEFYENYSKIFPNYTNVPEAKYMYKNIKRKQKVIDNNQAQKQTDSVAEEDGEFRVLNTEAYESIMNQTQKQNESKMSKMDETAQSLEGIIDAIGKAEKTIVVASEQNRMSSKVSQQNKESTPTNYNIATSSGGGNKKNPYNFHLDLKGINSKNLNENFQKTQDKNTATSSNPSTANTGNKLIINQIDEIQKLQLKVSAGLIHSERNPKKETIDVEAIDAKRKLNAKTPKGEIGEVYSNNYPSKALAGIEKTKEYHNYVQNTKSARNSKNFEFTDMLRQENFKINQKNLKEKPNQNKDKIIYEEEASQVQNNKEDVKPYHKSTISMPKLPSSTIYNNYNIINNYQNIIVPDSILGKSSKNSSNKNTIDYDKKSTANNTNTKPDGTKYIKNFSKDLEKIKQNVKKILNEYNYCGSTTTRSKEKPNSIMDSAKGKKSERMISDRNYPLSARNEKDLEIAQIKQLLQMNQAGIDNEADNERIRFTTKKLISEILTENAKNKPVTRNLAEKVSSGYEEKTSGNKLTYLTSSINFEKAHATISHNSSNNNILQTNKKLNTARDVKTVAKGLNNADKPNAPSGFNKGTGKIFHYQDQIVKSQNISPSMTKGSNNNVKKPNGLNGQGFHQKTNSMNPSHIKTTIASLTPNTNSQKTSSKQITAAQPVLSSQSKGIVNSNYQSTSNNPQKIISNNFVSNQVADTSRKAQDVKKMLKIKNFYEITKLSELKANTDRAHYQQETSNRQHKI